MSLASDMSADFRDRENRNAKACETLALLGYYWNGCKWTDEPTAEDRLEAIRKVIDDGPLYNDKTDRIDHILRPTWRKPRGA
jgi:hypothetical protein